MHLHALHRLLTLLASVFLRLKLEKFVDVILNISHNTSFCFTEQQTNILQTDLNAAFNYLRFLFARTRLLRFAFRLIGMPLSILLGYWKLEINSMKVKFIPQVIKVTQTSIMINSQPGADNFSAPIGGRFKQKELGCDWVGIRKDSFMMTDACSLSLFKHF